MSIEPFLLRSLTMVAPPAGTRGELFRLFAARAARRFRGREGAPDAERLLELLERRERELPTVAPEGIAFPHAIDEAIPESLIGAALLRPPVNFADAGPPVRLSFVLFGSGATPIVHVRTLARLARIAHDEVGRRRLVEASDDADLHRRILEEDLKHH
ncbi:MAG TPA: PTS sugar transporter subunit IIA [Phycisphaerales bacterium]|nr:PTS sugar transporter subunit IIA [Phycisphaerales bacterium]HMP38175.1 PTS sugar transporter subunit IIA [Phycisphaerales bacterium]